MKKSVLFFTVLLIPMDIAMILLAVILAYKFRFYFEYVPATHFEPFYNYSMTFVIFMPFWILIYAINGLYSIIDRNQSWNEFGKIIVATSAAIALMIVWIFLSRTFFFSRLIIIFIWVFSIIFVALGRFIIRYVKKFLYRYDVGVNRLIILGQNSFTEPIINEIKKNKSLGYRVVKVIDRDGINNLEKIIKNTPCDKILVTDTHLPEGQMDKVLQFCRLNRIGLEVTPDLFLMRSSHVSVQSLAGIPIFEYKRTPLDGWGKIIKRALDLVGSGLLILLASPIMIIIALAVKITSRGPIFFRQERVGLDKNFKIFKFRTMRENADKLHAEYMKKYGLMFKLKKDPRLTPIGGFLRKTSLDELPQFFNVFLGQMSLIGPRPPMPQEVAKYTDWQKLRLGVKPGMSGLWQVSGRSDISFDEWVKLDAYYIENWSLWLDFLIFLKTIKVVFFGKGAY